VFDLTSMWVSPEVRRIGLGTRLVQHALNWARSCGAVRVHLWVTVGNEPAERLYDGLGFIATGEEQPLPSDETKREREMMLTLR
jgi:ribosomal protein S18 acetylase RimI-like enzyme